MKDKIIFLSGYKIIVVPIEVWEIYEEGFRSEDPVIRNMTIDILKTGQIYKNERKKD